MVSIFLKGNKSCDPSSTFMVFLLFFGAKLLFETTFVRTQLLFERAAS
jgi:hypothetical protein